MSIIAIGLNLLLVVLLGAALFVGWRLNARLKALRQSHEGFARAVGELNAAARRAEQGLADLRAASDEAGDLLGERMEKARALAQKLERLIEQGGPLAERAPEIDPAAERRLGSLLALARQPRGRPEPEPASDRPMAPAAREPLILRRPSSFDDDLFDMPAEPRSARR